MGLLNKIKNHFNKAKSEVDKAKPEPKKADAKLADKEPPAKPEPKKTDAKPATTIANNGALPGVFTVAANKKVRFSMGNLQFNPKKYEFRFALHQYDIIGNDNAKIAPNYNGWIDLFGYGTSGYMGLQPYETSTDTQKYLNQDINGTNYDWGVYNPIGNGGNKAGLWRTLTKDEWKYLAETRPNATKLRSYARVNGIFGYIYLPDDFYEHRVSVPVNSSTPYDLTQWAILEAAGAVFLPFCEKRKGNAMEQKVDPFYWTSTGYRYLPGYATYISIGGQDGSLPSFTGFSVRLVQDK